MNDAIARPPAAGPQATFIRVLATWFGLGYAPVAPGTFGTAGALPLWWGLTLIAVQPVWAWQIGAALFSALVAIAVAARADAVFGKHDDGRVVIDEVAGLLVATVGVPFTVGTVLAAFVIFRLLDALKPGPIGWLDKNVHGGVGVVVDDLAAGAVTCAALWLGRAALGAWW